MPAAPTSARAGAVEAAAARLLGAAATAIPCAPVRDVLGDDVAAAYAAQDLIVAAGVGRGRTVSGWKVGLTSHAVQVQLGVDQPDFGRLFADMEVADGGTVATGRLLQPRIEAEIAFVMGGPIDGAITAPSLRASIAAAMAAFEVVDSRVAGWDIRLTDTVADNASCGLYVLGPDRVALDDVDLPSVAMDMRADGATVSSGHGRDCLGDPLLAALWVARTAAQRGRPLREGDVVLAGALGPMVPATPGSTYTAELSGLGAIAVTFEAHP